MKLVSSRFLSVAGVFAAGVIAVCANVLSYRFYQRWDWTSSGLYTLSSATEETLRSLPEPVDVVVFLAASDPLRGSVEHMLTAYGAQSKLLRPRYVDPDRSPAEFIALQKEYGITAGKTEDGRLVADASVVLSRGDQRWYVTNEDMVVYSEKDDRARPALEQALTEGLRQVLSREKTRVCFTTGHQEISSDDGGPRGLAELKYRIQKDNYTTEVVDLAGARGGVALDTCRVIVVASPEVSLSPAASKRLEAYFAAGGNLFILSNPILDDANRIRSSGLERLAAQGGIELSADFIVERDPEVRMPEGLGETFFATPQQHDVTLGLMEDGEPRKRPLITAAQGLRPIRDSAARVLLQTSAQAFSVKDIRPFVDEGKAVEKGAGDASGPFAVAMAVERPLPAGSREKHGPRMVVVGSASVAFGQAWRDATLLGNRIFTESALSWLAAKPPLVSVPLKPSHPAGLRLTEESVSEVQRYVLIYMPGTALGLGLLILLRRRTTERRSRRDTHDKAGRAGGPTP